MLRVSTRTSTLFFVSLLVLLAGLPVTAGEPTLLQPAHDANDRRPSWSPDGERLVFESDREGRWQLFTVSAEGSSAERLLTSPHHDRQARWSPDGKRLVFQQTEKGKSPQLQILHLETGDLELVRTFPGAVSDPDWSPDGSALVFSVERDGTRNLVHLDLKTGHETPLTEGKFRSLWPRWSADNRIIYFSRAGSAGKHDDLYVLRAPFGQKPPKRITTADAHEFCPELSPDGSQIIYAKGGVEARELRLLDLETGSEESLAQGFERINAPTWSADGRIAFSARAKDGPYGIYVLNLNARSTPTENPQ